MWVKLVVSVALLPMLVHSVLGCCWHHTHSKYGLPCTHARVESHADHNHQNGHRHADGQPNGSRVPVAPAPCQHHEPCDGIECVYLVANPGGTTYAFDSFAAFKEYDAGSNVLLSMTSAATGKLHQNQDIYAAMQHCALTQVWIV